MGCAQSKIENEESVSRCKERRNLMKDAVAIRNAFASAHSGHSISLKDTGSALAEYAHGEIPPPPPEAAPPPDLTPFEKPPPPPPMDSTLPPSPPPLPSFSPMPPLKRAVTMPATLSQGVKGKMKGIAMDDDDIYEEEEDDVEEEEDEDDKLVFQRRKKVVKEGKADATPLRAPPNPATSLVNKGVAWDYFFMDNIPQSNLDEVEEDEVVEEGADNPDSFENIEFKTPEKLKQVGFEGIEEFKTPNRTPASIVAEKQFVHSNTAPPTINRFSGDGNVVGNHARNNNVVDLLKILSEVDDNFLKASQSAQEVSKMLEATRLHYHSNFADNRGHIDHAARVMQVITWNQSFRGVPNGDATKDNPEADDYETHATVLDKLLAWEKKLYEEVKTSEIIKFEYQRKVAHLNKLKKRNASSEQLEKAKAAVSHLHTRYIVDMQSLDSTVSEVNDIRDKQLYPKLVSLVRGMAKMWESVCACHDAQLRAVAGLRALDASGLTITETTKHHHARTRQLSSIVDQWHSHFDKLVIAQRNYISTLNAWLKLNLVPIETTTALREKPAADPSSSHHPEPPTPIQPLLRSWHDSLEKLPDDVARGAISSFAAVVRTIIVHQEDEMRLKERHEETQREYARRKQAFEEWLERHVRRRGPSEEGEPGRDPVGERQLAVENLRKRAEEEMEEHQKQCVQVREKSLGSLKLKLPELFRALSDYAHACRDAYDGLRALVEGP